MYCVDEDNDGVWGWDAQNLTQCDYGCIDDMGDDTWDASCLTTPPEYAESIAKSFGKTSWVIQQSFNTPPDKFFFFLMVMTGTGVGVAYAMGGEFGVVTALGVMLIGASMGWIPIYIAVIMSIGGMMIWREQVVRGVRKVGKTIKSVRS